MLLTIIITEQDVIVLLTGFVLGLIAYRASEIISSNKDDMDDNGFTGI